MYRWLLVEELMSGWQRRGYLKLFHNPISNASPPGVCMELREMEGFSQTEYSAECRT
jgi:hypothetical protein